jgi:hypothetical protein
MELSTRESMTRRLGRDVGRAFKSGRMAQDMKDIGNSIRPMGMDVSFMQMEMSM